MLFISKLNSQCRRLSRSVQRVFHLAREKKGWQEKGPIPLFKTSQNTTRSVSVRYEIGGVININIFFLIPEY